VRLFTTIAALRYFLDVCRRDNKSEQPLLLTGVGLIPTMGALHQGHLSLVERARSENATVIVSIFVNPLQFGPNEDYQRYPRTFDNDWQFCLQAGVDAIFAPNNKEMLKNQESDLPDSSVILSAEQSTNEYTQVIPPPAMMSYLCGRSRSGHFQGVATIVTKLLNIVQPDRAYFGQKDGQQLAIIRRVVADLNNPTKIVACPTVREASGLAMSSRNQYLTAEQKSVAAVLYQGLQRAEVAFKAGERRSWRLIELVKSTVSQESTVSIEYIELVEPTTLMFLEKVEEEGMVAIAARLGYTRLIDNIILRDRQPVIAIDGPAGAGKSTVARRVAVELGLTYLDTGAMYRALTWLVLQSNIALDDDFAIAELANRAKIRLVPTEDINCPVRVLIDEQDITQVIRSPEVTSKVSVIAAQSAVRTALVQQQQQLGKKGGLVAEGRDIGTHVFPEADLKIFLTASVLERARRRLQDFKTQGQAPVSLEQLEQDIAERDHKDSTRPVSPLQKADDAIEIQSDGLSINQVIAEIVECYQERLSSS